ncbi:MAG: hypothetical protein GWN87_13135, partial [Desulfuromonadales bacterium]|nr:hypothetical protein [Desulfuromonadales bacterium]
GLDPVAVKPGDAAQPTAETIGMPPAPGMGGGRLFLLALFVGVAMGVLYYFEQAGGIPSESRIPIHATVAALGFVALVLVWGALRGRRQASRDMLNRIGVVSGGGVALEEGDGRLTYVNERFLEFLSVCGAETKEESGLWTMYVFRTENDAARAFKRLRDDALNGTAKQAEITLP